MIDICPFFHSIPFSFILASRPEQHIREAFDVKPLSLLQKYCRRASIFDNDYHLFTLNRLLADNLKGLTRLKYITYVILKPVNQSYQTANHSQNWIKMT